MKEANKPHRAVLRINLSLHTILNTGECSSRSVEKEILDKCGLREDFLLYIDGKDQWDCLSKIQKKISEFRGENGST
jgi:hypothetical protein